MLKDFRFQGAPLFDPGQVTLVSLAIGVVLGLVLVRFLLRQPMAAAFDEGRKLTDLLGWTSLLPQMLAALGAVFALAGVGNALGTIAAEVIPADSRLAAVVVYTLGMALFTAIMGNAFAAFPVMATAIGVPILIQQDGGNPAVIGAVGMLTGFCGTLMTPMAANFNIVPAALLELKNQYGVIRMQIATAIPLLIANILILYIAGFRL
jgi:uncharacterized membrane protein